MSSKSRILVQLDSDPHPSVFDRVVAIDGGAQQVLAYGGVTLEHVEALVHGAIFTRGPQDLAHTAIFIGGSDVALGQAVLERVVKTFIGPLRVSVMLDSNGSNTTAAAAVLTAAKHLDLSAGPDTLVLGSGPVGQRAARLLAGEGAMVRLASRSLDRAGEAAAAINRDVGKLRVTGVMTTSAEQVAQALEKAALVIAAGPAGVQLLPQAIWQASPTLKVAIDLNAVPPLGIEGVEVMDKAAQRGNVLTYGAIGVGGTKMKIHKAAVASLFEANDRVLDVAAIYEIGKTIAR